MIARPARHAIYQRAREVERLSGVPQSIRPQQYLDENVRRVSDDVASVAALPMPDEKLAEGLRKKQREPGRFRQMITHVVSVPSPLPLQWPQRGGECSGDFRRRRSIMRRRGKTP